MNIKQLAETVMAIDAHQLDHPGYCADIAKNIINGELKKLWRESYGAEILESRAEIFRPLHSNVRPD